MAEFSIFKLALTFFLVANPIGNTPCIVALVKDFSFERQKKIIFRESVISLIIVLFFQFCGEFFLNLLNIETYTVTICGGLLLFIVAMSMIFAKPPEKDGTPALKQEPFIVPIATPILSGPGLMATVMIYASQIPSTMTITGAILIAWVGVIGVLAAAPYLQSIFGKRGLIALEQLMGMILAAMSMGMLVRGIAMFLNQIHVN